MREFMKFLGVLKKLWVTACLLTAASAFAQSSPIQIVVPFPASSPSSELARQMAVPLAAKLGQPVNIEYRPGGNSKVAQDHVRNAKPDGLTFLWATSAMVVEPVIAGTPQEVSRDLMPLGMSMRSSLVMVARPGLAQRSFAEVLAHVRSGGSLTCGYGGGAMLLACSALKQLNPNGVTAVAYQSSGLAVPDVVGDRLDVAFMLLEPTLKSLISTNKLRLLGRTNSISTDAVVAQAPRLDVQLSALNVAPWMAWFAPMGTPLDATQRFVRAAQEVLAEPAMLAKLDDYDFRPENMAANDFSVFLTQEYQRYNQLLRGAR
jgi:tripartite-type tricarboxylate transporter receptor subunit TctC